MRVLKPRQAMLIFSIWTIKSQENELGDTDEWAVCNSGIRVLREVCVKRPERWGDRNFFETIFLNMLKRGRIESTFVAWASTLSVLKMTTEWSVEAEKRYWALRKQVFWRFLLTERRFLSEVLRLKSHIWALRKQVFWRFFMNRKEFFDRRVEAEKLYRALRKQVFKPDGLTNNFEGIFEWSLR